MLFYPQSSKSINLEANQEETAPEFIDNQGSKVTRDKFKLS